MKSDISEIDAKNVIFTSPSGLKLGLDLMVGEIAKFVDEDPSSFYRLVIGSDSQARRDNGDSEVDFVTAVVVHRIGKGARYFYR